MFVQNKCGEVVNLDHVIAFKFFDDKAPYNLHLFTEKTETIFQFDSVEAIKTAIDKIMPKLMRQCLRWAKCYTKNQNWQFRSDKILSINDECCRNLTVSMVGRNFSVYTGAETDEELWSCKKQITESLSEDPFNSGIIVFEVLT